MNYPPGMNESDIPGNTDQDEWYEEIESNLDEEVFEALNTLNHPFNPSLQSCIESFDLDDDPRYVAEKVNDKYYEEDDQ